MFLFFCQHKIVCRQIATPVIGQQRLKLQSNAIFWSTPYLTPDSILMILQGGNKGKTTTTTTIISQQPSAIFPCLSVCIVRAGDLTGLWTAAAADCFE